MAMTHPSSLHPRYQASSITTEQSVPVWRIGSGDIAEKLATPVVSPSTPTICTFVTILRVREGGFSA
jgi:hypothetical protein